MKERKAFQCEFCNKIYLTKKTARAHEARCFKNPKSRSCITCKNFGVEVATIYKGYCDESEETDTVEVCRIGLSSYTDEEENKKRIGHARYDPNEFDELSEKLLLGDDARSLYTPRQGGFKLNTNCDYYIEKNI